MFGISLPSVSDVTHAVTGAASSALSTTEDLGSAAVSHATSLGRSGLDLGRSVVTTVSHLNVQKLGSTATAAIGKAETYAEHGIQTGVMKAGQGVHSAADYGRSHISGSDPLSRLARGAITVTEDQTRFDIGVVGGVGKAAVGLVGSAGQLGVLATEYQVSPSAKAAIDAKISGAVVGGAKSLAGYADSVAHDPSRVIGDATHVATATTGWATSEVNSAEQAIKDGHGPESFGMQVGNAATYLIPVGGEARIAAEGGELATRALVPAIAEDGTRAAVGDGAKTLAKDAGTTATGSGGEAAVRDGSSAAADAPGVSETSSSAPGRAPGVRPSWRTSELDVGASIEGRGYRAQISFKDGSEVPYGTKGSVRPEYYSPGSSVEVKNYNVETAGGRANLVRNVSRQVVARAEELPAGTTQSVYIDVRGQAVSRADLNTTVNRIVERSNGAVQPSDINIVR